MQKFSPAKHDKDHSALKEQSEREWNEKREEIPLFKPLT